jgi:sugar O-acyltransferase (sialic acid O-acetyltransferase NeuD family)
MEKITLWRKPWVTVGFSPALLLTCVVDKARGALDDATVEEHDEVLIFGAGGPLTPELEESCARLGLRVAAAVLNRPGPGFSIEPTRLMAAQDLRPEQRNLPFLCPLFTPANRRLAVAEALALGLRPAPALIDPTAILAVSASVAVGSFVNAGCIIGSLTRIGRHVLVNRGASLGHHAEIDDFASIGPGAVLAGQIRVGAGALIGAGAVVEPGLTLGEGSVLAAGAVLRRDLPSGALAAGNPARILREACSAA